MTDLLSRVEDDERIAAVAATGLLALPAVDGLDRLTRLAARLLTAPTSLVSTLTGDRQVFASQFGLPHPWSDVAQTPLSHSFCRYVVEDDAPLVVGDARVDPRVRHNPAIDEMGVVAYAGMPIRVNGHTLGAFCVLDGRPRDWSRQDLRTLADLANAVESEIALMTAVRRAEEEATTLGKIIKVSPDPYVSIDADGAVLDWNPAAEALFGWSRDEVLGVDLATLIIPERHRQAHRDGLARARGTGVSVLAEQRVQLPATARDGRTVPVEFTLQMTETGGRRVFHAFLHDLSAQVAADERLRRQTELTDAAAAAIIVRDLDGIVSVWNRGAEQMYGWPADAVIGRNVHRLLSTEAPGGLPAMRQALLDTGAWQGELSHRCSDGRLILVQSRHTVRSAADGIGLEVVETTTDITDRRQAEQALATRERQFRVQFDQSTVGQSIVGLDGRMVRVNDAYAQMLGLTSQEMVGRSINDFTHEDDRGEGIRLLAGLYAGEYDSYERTKRVSRPDGREVVLHVGSRLVRDAAGLPSHLIGVIQDITAQVRAQHERDAAHDTLSERNGQLQLLNAELERANLLKLDLMGMLSHDIGTPLATILGYSEILAESGLAPALARPAGKIVRAANRIDELRHNVLSMCSLDAATLQTEREEVALLGALRDATDAADVEVVIGCPPGAVALVNPAHLRQIVVNFLINAAKYAGGATSVTVTELAATYVIAVHDRGPGVPAELRDHLFERFSRAADATEPGHGLGLHIVASLAEANGGAVGYHHHEPAGSVFSLHLDKAPAGP